MMSCRLLAYHCRPRALARAAVRCCASLSYVQRIKLLQAMKESDERHTEMLEQGQFLPFLKRRPLVQASNKEHDDNSYSKDYGSQTLKWINYPALQGLCPATDLPSRAVLLHVSESGRPCFTVSIPGGAAGAGLARLTEAAAFVDPRVALFTLPWEEACVMSHAFAVLHWHAVTNFCPGCGAELRRRPAGHAKSCPACEAVQYPVTSPVGITMVTDVAQTRALLVRQGRHPPGMYSCVAGFLEPGETIESCVRREVAEEVGLEVRGVRYAASQHWPFNGSSLMVGCYATTDQTELDIDRDELEDAQWFSVSQVHDAFQRILRNPEVRLQKENTGGLWVPPRGTVAHQLIKAWLTDCGLLS